MTDWIDTYRARQLAEAEDRAAIDRIMLRSVWPGRPMRRRVTLDEIIFWTGAVVAVIALAALALKGWQNFWIITEPLVMSAT